MYIWWFISSILKIYFTNFPISISLNTVCFINCAWRYFSFSNLKSQNFSKCLHDGLNNKKLSLKHVCTMISKYSSKLCIQNFSSKKSNSSCFFIDCLLLLLGYFIKLLDIVKKNYYFQVCRQIYGRQYFSSYKYP